MIPPAARFGARMYEREWREDLLPRYVAAVDRAEERVDKADASELMALIDELRAGRRLFRLDGGGRRLCLQGRGNVGDIGSPLAHASIIAREYGIPAVVGCGDATLRLKDGQRVTVDGTAGVVER